MKNGDTIYVVTTGEYSDYGVAGVYTTKEEAEAVKAVLRDANDVAEYVLGEGIDKATQGLYPYLVVMHYNGNGAMAHCQSGLELNPFHAEAFNMAVSMSCWARDEQHAIKILNEKRIQWLAEGGQTK
jgi:hypothetical protein